MNKGDPIPTRFDPAEDQAINEIAKRTGLPKAEIVRRAVRLLAQQVKTRGEVGFIVQELSPETWHPREKPIIIPKTPIPTNKSSEYPSPLAPSAERRKDRSKRGKDDQGDPQNKTGYKKRDVPERD